MNKIYKVIWNVSLATWVVASEVACSASKCKQSTKKSLNSNVKQNIKKHSGLSLILPPLTVAIILCGMSMSANATCSAAGSIITCSGVPTLPLFLNDYSSEISGLTVNVTNGTQMNATLGGTVINLTGANINLNNSGTLDPALLGLVSILSGGAFIGTGANSTVSIVNTTTGLIRGTGMLLGLNLTSIDGLGIAVNNSVSGTTTITNNGAITSTGLSVGGITLADTPVVGGMAVRKST